MAGTAKLPESATGPEEPLSATERQAFETLVQDSLPAVRTMVQAWRAGLSVLITLVTTGIVLQGRNTIANLPTSWRAAVTCTVGFGLVLAAAGLWNTLTAEVGDRTRLRTLAEIHANYASVAAYQVGLANAAARRLQIARIMVAIALGLILTGVFLTWWAPPAHTDPPAYLAVNHLGGKVCGRLQSAAGGLLRLAVPGAHEDVIIPLGTITNLALVARCPES